MMKKIAFYIESWVCGGAEKQLIDLVNHFDYSKYRITIISIFRKSVYDNYTFQLDDRINPQVELKYLIDNGNPMVYRLFNHAFSHLSRRLLYRMLIKEKYDYEIAYYEGLPTLFVANSANRSSKKYAWLHTDNHRLYQNKRSDELMNVSKLYSKFDKVVGVSECTEQSFKDFFPELNTCTIANGLDIELIKKKAEEECPYPDFEEMTFVSVGRFTQVKGYLRLLQVLDKLHTEGYQFKLVLVGDGDEKNNLVKYVSERGLNTCVLFAGSQANPYKYFKNADYYVCSSYFEGFGLTVAESIVCGLPVLVTDSVRSVLGNEKCGTICENTETGLYDMLKSAMDGKYNYQEFIRGCMIRREELSIHQTVHNVERLLQGDQYE